MMMSSHHSVAKKKKITTDEISPDGFKAPLGGHGGMQCARRVALGSPARLTEDRAETGCTESPLCGERPKQRGQCPEVSRGMAARWEKFHGSDSRVLMLENAQCHGGSESKPAPLHMPVAKPCSPNRAGGAGCPLLSVPSYPGVDLSLGSRDRVQCSGELLQKCSLQTYFQRQS